MARGKAASAEAPAQDNTAASGNGSTVRMKRDPEQYPEPHEADVHPDEVANYAAAGWQFA